MVIFFFCKNHRQQWFFDGFRVPQPSPLTDFQLPDHCFQWFFDGFGVIHPAVEGDPGIWHCSFWLSAVVLNKHKSTCALLLPPDLQLAGDIFGPSEWCSCLCWHVDWSCTQKNMMSKARY